ncbi:MAG: GAF domain-containing protein [Caldithrix sp.]|nr:GAF domain-containing protein [Caldithrix sp.]
MKISLEILSRFEKLTAISSDTSEFFKEISTIVCRLLSAQYVLIALYDKMTSELYYTHISGNDNQLGESCGDDKEDFRRVHIGEGIIGWCVKERQMVNLVHPEKDSRFNPRVDKPHGITFHSLLAVPMYSRNELMGIILAANKQKTHRFGKKDEELLKFITSQTALQIDNQKLFEENMNLGQLSDLGQGILNSAHGLKNILNNMDGATFIVERGVFKKDMNNVNKGWDILKRNSNRLRDLVLEILLFSRPGKPQYEPSDLNKICKDLVELMYKNAAAEGVKLKMQLDDEITQVCIDPKGIYRCILNLTSNAIYACQREGGGTVTLITRKVNPDNFQIIVKDTGTGITEENLEHIFDVFFSTKGSKGTGLGLPVTKKIVTEHKGTLDVDSEVDVGTTFTINLPIRKDFTCH